MPELDPLLGIMTGKNLYPSSIRSTAPRTLDPPGRAVLLAAHGSRCQLQSGIGAQEHARRLESEYGVQEVAVAFRQGEPSFSEVLNSISSREITVVPFFSCHGYFSQRVLPRELSLNRHYSRRRVRFTEPVGTHPRIPGLVEQRMGEIFRWFQLRPERTALVIVGHGTHRHATSASSTLNLASHLTKNVPCANVQPAFLDEPPFLEETFHNLSQDQIVVLPFFMGD